MCLKLTIIMLITIVKTLGTIRKTKHELMIENSADYYAVIKILVLKTM